MLKTECRVSLCHLVRPDRYGDHHQILNRGEMVDRLVLAKGMINC